MTKYFLLGTVLTAMIFLNIITAYPQGQGGGGDSCAQYQAQCVNGSSLASQGATSGIGAFPNNPLPVNQINMTAVQQMPYCEALAQACRTQTPPTPPSVPAAPDMPAGVPPLSPPGGFFNSLKSLFSF